VVIFPNPAFGGVLLRGLALPSREVLFSRRATGKKTWLAMQLWAASRVLTYREVAAAVWAKQAIGQR